MGRYRPVECLVVIMGGEAIYIQGHVRYQHGGEQQPVVQHTGIQEGLEDASRAAGRGNDVHLVPPPLVGRIGSVSGVGQYLPGLHVRYDRRQIIDMVGTVFTGITVYEGLCLSLQGLADGGLDALPRLFRGQSFQQMRGIIR